MLLQMLRLEFEMMTWQGKNELWRILGRLWLCHAYFTVAGSNNDFDVTIRVFSMNNILVEPKPSNSQLTADGIIRSTTWQLAYT